MSEEVKDFEISVRVTIDITKKVSADSLENAKEIAEQFAMDDICSGHFTDVDIESF